LVEFRTNALFAITANWGAASNNQRGLDYLQRGNPAYLLPEFAQKAPWRVSVSLPMNTLKADEPASGAEIRIDVHDWQLGAPVDGGYPNPANLGAVKAPSDIAQVRVEIPGLIPSAITIDPGSAGGSGFVRTFTTNITNAGEAPEGTYLGLVEVVDSRTGDQGLAQDNPAPFALGQLATYQLFEIPVAPPTSTGTFGEPRLVTLYEPNTFVGNFNMTVAELTTNGTDLYFIYEGGLYQLVLARSTNGGNLFSNFDVLEEIYGPCDPILAVERGTNTLHVSAAAPYEDGLWSLTTTNNGTSWGALKPIWQEEFTDVDVHTICAAPGEMPVAIFGQSTFTTGLQSVLDSARLNGANWVDGGSPSDVHPYAGDLYRVDTDPGVVRLEDGTLVCLIMTNVRGIEANGDEELFEPVAVRSTNDGIAWQGWNYLHSLPTTSIDNISLTVKGNDVYVLELTGEHDLRLFKSTTAGASWTPMPLPAFLPKVHSRFGDISSGPGGLMAITYGPDNDNYWEADDLFVIKSTDSGATWGEPIRADGDPDKEFLVSAACSVFTDDGKLHVAFQDTRYWVEYKWSIVNEQ
ncbi:MAG TPA: sialidase family protein, partial [bacterium]|nr:sialidase family protein [bacterium]